MGYRQEVKAQHFDCYIMGSNPITPVWQDYAIFVFLLAKSRRKTPFPHQRKAVKSHRTARCGCSGVYPTMPELTYFFRTGPMQFHYNFLTPITHRCLHTILKAYTEVYAILAYSSVVERLTVNQDVAGSIPAMPVMSTLVQKPMSAMEEQKLAVDIILLLSTNIDNDGSGTVQQSPYELYKYSNKNNSIRKQML